MASDDEDELEVYMRQLENEENSKPKIELINQDSDVEEELVQEDGTIEDIEADVKATISGANAPTNKIKKMLSEISKRKVDYIMFKKGFYVEVPELSRLSDDDVSEIRMSLENIEVDKDFCPKPITCWAHCGLSRKILSVLKRCEFPNPTPIQAQAIPAIMSGYDVIGVAKTGCGKTLSFLLPMFRHILDQPKLERGDGPIGLVIAPTRELATQICNDASKFTKGLGLKVVSIYGGPNISEHIALLKQGAEIVVCTPGRMIEILTVNGGRVTNMNRCTFLVLDEADRLFDMGFEKQIRSIIDLIRPDRQTVMFSATFYTKLKAHAKKILNNPIEIRIGGQSVVCKDVMQHVEIIDEDDKFLRLIRILQQHVDVDTCAIVFVGKQTKADSLLDDLLQAYSSDCLALHGGIDKDDRMSIFASFKSGQAKVLVATSVAARGLDVKHCTCVVNYDCPNHYEDYVHRCGRTGRAGRKGDSYTFITPDQGNLAPDLIKAFELSENPVPTELQKLWDDYKETAEKLGKKIWSSSGFSGRGYKFDEAEDEINNEKKKYQKKSLGLQGSDDEDDNALKNNDDILEDTIMESITNKDSAIPIKSKTLSKLDLVKQRVEILLAQKNIVRKPDITTLVQEVVLNSNTQIPAKERIELKVEINDYNQQTRRRLTSKEALAKISEACGVGITVRGQFCAPGDRPIEPKLYLAIEGTSQQSLAEAKREVLLLVKDEYIRVNKKSKGIVS